MKLRAFLSAIILAAAALSSAASDLISTAPPSSLFNIGVRIGVNNSNRTFPAEGFNTWNVNSWGSGFDAGIVVNLNMKEFLAIQPGIFFDSRSGNYAYVQKFINRQNEDDNLTQLGHLRTYNITIPVMLSFRLNLAPSFQLIPEIGPYAQFKLKASDSGKIDVVSQPEGTNLIYVDTAKSKFADFGLKIGAALSFRSRYSVGVHYLAGACDVWKEPVKGGKNKEWLFTVGYDF